MSHELLAVAATVPIVVSLLLAALARRTAFAATGAVAFLALATAASVHHRLTRPHAVPEAAVVGRPIQVEHDGYVSSSTCRACHPHEHDTWHDSYHRSMTQVASPATVLADFQGELTVDGQVWRLERRGDEFWVDMADPVAMPGSTPGRVQRRVVTTTGSHTMQLYWFGSGYGRVTGLLPFAWQVAERRWIPRRAAFVRPADDRIDAEMGSWNYICVKCHATAAKPRLDWDQGGLRDADTHLGEFGIACEACHGPGGEHVRKHQNPLARYTARADDAPDTTIVNPARLDHVRSTQVCGQCHGNWDYLFAGNEARTRDWFQNGFAYRPGQDVLQQRKLKFEGEEQFWSDGLIRVAGREYNALVGSACFDKGELSCLSCHQAHQRPDDPRPRSAWADDMLVAASDDSTCLQCHPTYADDPSAHTHHAADSAGSRCHNCHMPHTTYGLLKGVRTHRIQSPSAGSSVRTGRPNACNQCHLDRSLGWTADHLQAWYAEAPPTLSADERDLAASVLWTLKGDAAQRALMAWSFGWAPAQQASGTEWMAPYLAELLDDPYEAVRVVAERSLRTLPDHVGPLVDVVGDPQRRTAAKADALARWRSAAATGPRAAAAPRPAVLLTAPDRLDETAFARLLRLRDNRPIRLQE
jgi:hypothetical protein